MPELVFTERFIEETSKVELQSKRNEIAEAIDRLAIFPDLGSSNLSIGLVEMYGPSVKKLIVNPFLIIYETKIEENTVYILGLKAQRESY